MEWGSADREEVVDPDALHDQELAWAHLLAVHVMRRLGRHRAALARFEDIFVPRRSRLDDHRAFEIHEAVGDVGVVVPRNALAGGESQYRDAQIGAFGDDLAAGDLVTPAIAILHRSIPLFDRPAAQLPPSKNSVRSRCAAIWGSISQA